MFHSLRKIRGIKNHSTVAKNEVNTVYHGWNLDFESIVVNTIWASDLIQNCNKYINTYMYMLIENVAMILARG